MDDKQLRHLSRRDLLSLLEELSRENDRLRSELDAANKKLENQELSLSKCGSLAEAALSLSGVFEAADRAASIYVDAVRKQSSNDGAPAATVDETQQIRPARHLVKNAERHSDLQHIGRHLGKGSSNG